MNTGIRIIFLGVAAFLLIAGFASAQEEPIAYTSLTMPIPLEQMRPITVENAREVIELGWFRQYDRHRETGWVYAVALNSDGNLLASGGDSGSVPIWNVATGERIALLGSNYEFGGIVRGLAFSPDNMQLAVATWGSSRPSALHICDIPEFTECSTVELGEDRFIYNVAISPDGRQLAIPSDYEQEFVAVIDTQTGEIMRTLPVEGDGFGVEFNPNGASLAAITDTGLYTWDISEYTPMFTRSGLRRSMAYSVDGTLLATSISHMQTEILDAKTGELFNTVTMYALGGMVFGADNRLVISAQSSNIYFWDIQNNEMLSNIDTGGYELYGLSTNASRTLFALSTTREFNAADTFLYGAPNCAVRASQRINLRAGSGMDTPIGGALQPGDLGFVIGQHDDNAGLTWWKLSNALWVRSDIVEVASGCHDVPAIDIQ